MVKKSNAAVLFLLVLLSVARPALPAQQEKRPMSFMDIINLRRAVEVDISPDGGAVLYSLREVNWEQGKAFTDIYLVDSAGKTTGQMTFTRDKNERSPKWSPDNVTFAFISDRSGKDQIYIMRKDAGEARQLTANDEGVGMFRFSKDGKYIAYTAGTKGERELWLVELPDGKPFKLVKDKKGVAALTWDPRSKVVYFTAPDSIDNIDLERVEKGFDVEIKDKPKPPLNIWMVDVAGRKVEKLVEVPGFTVGYMTLSRDGRRLAFQARSVDRYSDFRDDELFLVNLETGKVTRLTDNHVAEGKPLFSPDSRWLVYTAPENYEFMRNDRVYILPATGGETRVLGKDFDTNESCDFFSDDSREIYFATSVGVNTNLYGIRIKGGRIEQVTNLDGVVWVSRDEDSGLCLVRYTDPYQPTDLYLVKERDLSEKERWVRLTDLNPQVNDIRLGKYETVYWKSTHGREIEGILVTPRGKTGPFLLIVQIHGGPASSVQNRFSGSWGYYVNVYTGAGYAVFQPNYRGSESYGERFRMEIAGDYFRQAFDDIMTGVDYLIERGVAHPDSLGFMGWSAGGHWSNWTLVSTDRFKAISTGAGAVNWISLYAQTDVQATREFYFQGQPYFNWDGYVRVSPLKYITNAKTPTLIHFGEKDERIPKPQGDELYMALKKLGVPVEYIVYPGMPHGLTSPRYQLVKMEAEFAWFEKWIRGKPTWLNWREILKTLPENREKQEK